jgi:thiol-disulfide isomerase/thioredoxin
MVYRRRDLLSLSAAGIAGMAGCLGGSSSGGNGENPAEETTNKANNWRSEPLEDVRTGESFTIGGHDVPVVLHTFAVWCGSCRTQQNHLAEFHEQHDGDVVGIDLNVDTNEGTERIEEHLEEHGHGWYFAVSPPGVTRGIVDTFSPKLASGPGSPVVVICPEGEHEILDDVSTPADDIETAVRACR